MAGGSRTTATTRGWASTAPAASASSRSRRWRSCRRRARRRAPTAWSSSPTRRKSSRRARRVFEFLLINHPLDCPVCDKGGECPLQDFSYSFGPERSRMEFPRRVFDGEGVKADVDFGPTLLLNRNRCILCTRCVRFMREVDGDAQIGIAQRGYGSEIATFEEQGVVSLLSGNLMDVCPVGAITTRDYRFKSRPWDNPQRRRHDLHALREGLQHHRVDQGQAGMGEGRAADSHDAAAQPGRQQLLDVRHRPLRLPLGRKRSPPAAAAPAAAAIRRGRSAVGRRAHRRQRRRGCGRRTRERPLPRLGARVARRAVRAANTRSAAPAASRQLADAREAAAGEHEVQDPAGRRAERARRARPRVRRRRAKARRRTSRGCDTAVEAGQVGVLYVFDSGPGRIDRRHRLDHRRARRPARSRRSSCRACCRRRWPKRPTSCCRARRSSRRTRPTRT